MRKDPFRESKSCIALLLYERVRREGEGGRFIASLRKEINYGTGSDDNSPWRIVKDDFPFGGGRENQWVEGVEEGRGYNSRRGGFFINRERVTRRGLERMRED